MLLQLQEAEALCSADPTCGGLEHGATGSLASFLRPLLPRAGLYDQGCDNWVTLCDADFTLESEEGSCSYLKKDQGFYAPALMHLCPADSCCGVASFSLSLRDVLCNVAGDRSRRAMPREHQRDGDLQRADVSGGLCNDRVD